MNPSDNPDLLPQKPTYQRLEHIRQVLVREGWPRELFRGYCLSGRKLEECRHICDSLYDTYSLDYVHGRVSGEFIPLHELHDAIYTAFVEEVEDFIKEYFADMVRARAGEGQALNPQQQRVVEQHAHPLLPKDHPDYIRLTELLGEELADKVARNLSTCDAADDLARIIIRLATMPNPPVDWLTLVETKTINVLQAHMPPTARSSANNVRKQIDRLCEINRIHRPKRSHRKGKK